jgi:hypothetical protein
MKKNDVGALLIFTLTSPSDSPISLVTATVATLTIQNAQSVKSLKNMTFYNTTAGKVSYTIEAGDLASTGVYKFEVYVEFSGGNKFTSSRTFDIVEPTL